MKFSELNSDFSNKIFVSCLKLLKMYSPIVFFKDGLKLYVFKRLKLKTVTHFVTQFSHVSKHFGVYSRKQKKIFRENCFENVVSYLKKNVLCVHKTTFRKK